MNLLKEPYLQGQNISQNLNICHIPGLLRVRHISTPCVCLYSYHTLSTVHCTNKGLSKPQEVGFTPLTKVIKLIVVFGDLLSAIKRYSWKIGEQYSSWNEGERGCRLEIIVDQYPWKSDLEPLFWKCFNADNFISMLIEEYQIIFSTL